MEVIEIRLCGPLEIRDAGSGELRSLGDGRPQRSALRALLAAPGRRLSRGALIELLWPERLDADNVAYAAIRDIRKALGKEHCRSFEGCYEIAGQRQIWLDIDTASELMCQAENCPSPALLEEVLAILERGAYLEGEEGAWCHRHRRRAEDMLRQARIWLAERYEAQGKPWQAGEQYRALCQGELVDEPALRAWIEMLARNRQPEEALRRYQEALLAAGYEFSPETVALAQSIQASVSRLVFTQQSSSLDLVPPSDLYDGIEVAAIAATLSCHSSPLDLERQIYSLIRNHDMHCDPSHDHDHRLSRRHALQVLARLPLQLALVGSTRPNPDILPLCATGLVACWQLLQHEPEGMSVIETALTGYLPTLEALTRAGQREAAALTAQGFLLASAIAEYNANIGQMEQASRKARQYAQLAGDANLELAALSRVAGALDYAHRDIASMRVYEEALALPYFSEASPMLQGRIYVGLAATHAYIGEDSQALSLLSQSRDVYPASPELDNAHIFAGSHSGAYSFAVWEGLVLKHSNRYPEATRAFLRFGSLEERPGLLETVRAEHLNYSATVAVRQGDLDAAVFYLDAANSVASTIQHEQRLAEVGDTLRSMSTTWRGEPRVKALREKIRG